MWWFTHAIVDMYFYTAAGAQCLLMLIQRKANGTKIASSKR